MLKYIETKIIKECSDCYFLGTFNGYMECNHPILNYKNLYSKNIITKENSDGRVPNECPLRENDIELQILLKKD